VAAFSLVLLFFVVETLSNLVGCLARPRFNGFGARLVGRVRALLRILAGQYSLVPMGDSLVSSEPVSGSETDHAAFDESYSLVCPIISGGASGGGGPAAICGSDNCWPDWCRTLGTCRFSFPIGPSGSIYRVSIISRCF